MADRFNSSHCAAGIWLVGHRLLWRRDALVFADWHGHKHDRHRVVVDPQTRCMKINACLFRIMIPLAMGILAAFPCSLSGQASSKGWDVAYLDQILAGARPDQVLVQAGDMQILVRNVKAWRGQLAGVPNPNLAFDGTAPTWTAGNVYYTFDGTISAFNQKVLLDGAVEWATFANLHFIARTTQANYVTIRQNPFLQPTTRCVAIRFSAMPGRDWFCTRAATGRRQHRP
jgi:hypothetical protein